MHGAAQECKRTASFLIRAGDPASGAPSAVYDRPPCRYARDAVDLNAPRMDSPFPACRRVNGTTHQAVGKQRDAPPCRGAQAAPWMDSAIAQC